MSDVAIPLWLHDVEVAALGIFVTLAFFMRKEVRRLKAQIRDLQSQVEALGETIHDLTTDLRLMISEYVSMRFAAKTYKASKDVLIAKCKWIAQRVPASMQDIKKKFSETINAAAAKDAANDAVAGSSRNAGSFDDLPTANDEAA